MSDEFYPNFGNAYPTTATTPAAESPAAWNPALRPDADDRAPGSDDDFFERYPGATPKKDHGATGAADAWTAPAAHDDEADDGARRSSSISVEQTVHVWTDTVPAENMQTKPESFAHVEAPMSLHGHEADSDADADLEDDVAGADSAQGPHEDTEATVFRPDETPTQQERDLEQLPDPQAAAVQPVADAAVKQTDHVADVSGEEVARPEEHYEHQGAVPEMEAALDEEPDAPLLENEQAPPTPGHVSREPTMGLGGTAPAAPHLHIDRSFTTNFTEASPQTGQPKDPLPSVPVGHAWPSYGDDKTFEELLDRKEQAPADQGPERHELTQAPSSTHEQTPPEPKPETPQHKDAASQDWPSGDGDDLFGELAGRAPAAAPEHAAEADAAAQGLGNATAPDATAKSGPQDEEEDLAAKFQAALDDDDLLDESNDLDPSKVFDDDDELLADDSFLSEPAQAPQPTQPPTRPSRSTSTAQYRPASAQQPQASPNPYAVQPQFVNQAHGRSAGTPDTGLYDIYSTQPVAPPPPQPAQRPGLQQAQSFADKSKGGYQSPYDLPMDVVKPRRRPAQHPAPVVMPTPPPRSSSFGTPSVPVQHTPPPVPHIPPPPRAPSAGTTSRPQSSRSGGSARPLRPGSRGVTSEKSTPQTNSGFFADLPVAPKPRARPTGAYTPQPTASPAFPAPPQSHPPIPPPQRPAAPPTPSQPPTYGGLRSPEKLPLLPDQPTPAPVQQSHAAPPASARYSPSSQPAPSATHSRYSPAPAPTSQPSVPAAPRYSPAPPAHPGQQPKRYPSSGSVSAASGMPSGNPFAPRTSSPLVHPHEKPHPPLPSEPPRHVATSPPASNGVLSFPPGTGLSPEKKPNKYSPASPPRTGYEPQAPFQAFSPPPPRPRTQSPDATMKSPKSGVTHMQRPTSSAGVPSLQSFALQPLQPLQPPGAAPSRGPALPHRRQFSREVNFAAPQDERGQDPLQRWRGHPIFSWNSAGTIVYTFPKYAPTWGGPGGASMKSTPGPLTVQDAGSFLPMDDRNAKFPGPLQAKAKGKKKEVMNWLNGKIEDLERLAEGTRLDFNLTADLKKRAEEKLVLWKMVRIFVEHDGVLEGNPKIEEEVRKVLLPNLEQMSRVVDLQSPVSAAATSSEPVDKDTLIQIRQALFEGQRERAVWFAEEKKIWGHAMLIASTMGPETWKQIVQSFVRSQVKSVGSDARSLAALYQVFAGNSEDCVDELVPPSARAGFQMVSKTDGSVSGNPLVGLDQWYETLELVTSNRTANDGPSLIALGKLLSGYGRVEAAHTCFLFGRVFAKHSGADDADADFVLLGADHRSQEEVVGNDLDTILLTEIYEWASSLSLSSTPVAYIPHLQSYKLLHAYQLTAYGLKSKAQAYCDHITQAYTSTTKPSQYYHPVFTQAVTDLQAFLAQAPHDGKGGFFSKPAMTKVSSGAANWFTKFVSGDDDQAQEGTSASAGLSDESGPFGRVSGEISRTTSGSDLYNPIMAGGGIPIKPSIAPATGSTFAPSSAPAGRYAPGSSYGGAPKAGPEHGGGAGPYAPPLQQALPAFSTGLSPQEGGAFSPTEVTNNLGVPSLAQPPRPVSAPRAASSRYAPAPHLASPHGLVTPSLGVPRPEANRAASDYGVPYNLSSRRSSAQTLNSQGSYEPSPSLAQEPNPYAYQASPLALPTHPADQPVAEEDVFGTKLNGIQVPTLEASSADEEGGSGGYQPPTAGYEPPSYQPYEPESDKSEEDAEATQQPKKKSALDDGDDDELEKRAAALKKAQADREADEAFRKAAEADTARDTSKHEQKKGGSGWFGSWFKKDQTAELNKPIRAKLGEESSFYYDENLKKWVNKKAGPEAATPAAATPPPPRGPARVASGLGFPSGPPSRAASAGPRPPTSGSAAAPPSGPPSRAGTPASIRSASGPADAALAANVNGDLAALHPPSGPPSRPPTGMSGASSLDDLLGGPPGPRKAGHGGTLKGKKKGGRYVDVMAK